MVLVSWRIRYLIGTYMYNTDETAPYGGVEYLYGTCTAGIERLMSLYLVPFGAGAVSGPVTAPVQCTHKHA